MERKDKTQQKRKLGFLEVFKQNIYLLKIVHSAVPWLIASMLSIAFLDGILIFLSQAYILRYIVNGVQTGKSFQNVAVFIVIFAVVELAILLIEAYFYNVYNAVSENKLYKNVQKRIFKKAAEVEIACFENPDFYDKYVKAVNEAVWRAFRVMGSLNSILSNIISISTMSFLIILIDPIIIIFALLPLLYSIILGKPLNKLRFDFNMEQQEKNRKCGYVQRVFYLSDYSKELRLSNIGGLMLKKFTGAINELKGLIPKYEVKTGAIEVVGHSVMSMVVYIGVIIYSSYHLLVTKNMLLGDCLVVINTITSVSWAIRYVSDSYMQFHEHALYIENLRYFLQYIPKISENKDGIQPSANPTLAVKDLSFKYTDDGKYVLKNINLSLRPGEKIALVGHNGSGKTTLIKLIMRLYDATEGVITLDDKSITEYNLEAYRNAFGTVFQDYKIFSLNVFENVLLKGDYTDAEAEIAINALKSSGGYEKAIRLKRGLETTLTREFDDEGAILSGGEQQKIAVARVFAKKCSIVILDEPSSALDPVAEYKMYEAIMQECKDKSLIFISHRLSSAVLADRVCLMDDGEIVEEGTHFELLIKNGKYADMWHKQAEKYRKEGVDFENI